MGFLTWTMVPSGFLHLTIWYFTGDAVLSGLAGVDDTWAMVMVGASAFLEAAEITVDWGAVSAMMIECKML